MSPVSCLPAYFVFGQQHLDVATCAERLAMYAADKAHGPEHRTLLVFLDQVLLHSIVQLQEHIQNVQQVSQFMATPDAHALTDAHCTIDTCQHLTNQHLQSCLACFSTVRVPSIPSAAPVAPT